MEDLVSYTINCLSFSLCCLSNSAIMRLLKESCSCSFPKELQKWHILGIINKVWYLLSSLENNYLMGIYIVIIEFTVF